MTTKSFASLSLLCICAMTAGVFAQEQSAEHAPAVSIPAVSIPAVSIPAVSIPAVPIEDSVHLENPVPVEDAISGSFGFDFVSQYFFRGILQENQGVIAQPWIELGVNLYEGDQTIRSVDVNVGLWNSLHSGPTGTGNATASGQTIWYESDFYAGLSIDLGEAFELSAVYTAYDSPNGSFETVQEVGFGVGYDDSSLWNDFGGLQPSLNLAFETSNQADGGRGLGTFLEVSVSPEFTLRDDETTPVTLTVPASVGLSLDDYFEDPTGDDHTFGFFDLGLEVGMPVSLIAARFGDWSMKVGAHLLWLGDTTEAINSGDSLEVIGSLGFQVDF